MRARGRHGSAEQPAARRHDALIGCGSQPLLVLPASRFFFQPLAVIGPQVIDDPNALPDAKAEAHCGEIIVSFKKVGHLGCYVDGQVGNETEWTHLDTVTAAYHDTRPLKVPNQPEKPRYRLCLWDGQPTRVWPQVVEMKS